MHLYLQGKCSRKQNTVVKNSFSFFIIKCCLSWCDQRPPHIGLMYTIKYNSSVQQIFENVLRYVMCFSQIIRSRIHSRHFLHIAATHAVRFLFFTSYPLRQQYILRYDSYSFGVYSA